MSITVERIGRRSYLRGNTYPCKDAIRSAGGKWDPDQRAWWIGNDEKAREIAEKCGGQPASAQGAEAGAERPAPGTDAIVAGRCKYQGRTYYLAGRVVRGRTHWDDTVDAVSTRDGAKFLLHFRDGSKSFWAARAEVQIDKTYQRPTTIGKLQRFAQDARAAGGAEELAEQRAQRSGVCRGCRGPIVDSAHHSATGGYCGSCAFDEYDC